jgi:pimeloyl-ACP methyl ester carboxylesterase
VTRVLLLPGLDGTGRLFADFARALPASVSPVALSYPTDTVLDYRELEPYVERALPRDGPFALVAESFSGPLALRIAARGPQGLIAVVLVASFVRPPRRALSLLRVLIRPSLFRVAPPRSAVRCALLGLDAPERVVNEFREAIALVSPGVLAARLREVARVDVIEELRRCPARLLYVAGQRDRLLPARVARELSALRPDMVIHSVDAPHLVLQRAGATVAGLVADFLAQP